MVRRWQLELMPILLLASLRSQLQYRVNFVVELFSGLLWHVSGLAFIGVVLSQFNQIADWSLGEVAFLYGLRMVVRGFYSVFLYGQGDSVRYEVQSGDADRWFTRPIPPLVQIIGGYFWVGSAAELAFGVALLAIAHGLTGLDLTAAGLAFLVVAVVGAALLEAALYLFGNALAFRLLEVGPLVAIMGDVLMYFGGYPLKIYGRVVEALLTFVVPLAFIGYFPATVLLNRTGELAVPPAVAYLTPVVGVVAFTFACLFFNRQTRHYQSAGH